MVCMARKSLLFLVGTCLITSAPSASAAEGPRPLSPAEVAAVELAVGYLAEGPDAWLDRLAADGALAALDPEAARAELAVRAGPPEDARWQLQTPTPGQPENRAIFSIEFPSGLGDTLAVDLLLAEAGWEIDRLLCLAEPWDSVAVTPPSLAASSPTPPPVRPIAGREGPTVLVAIGLLLLAASIRRSAWRRRTATAGLLLSAAGLSVLVLLPGCRQAASPEPPAALPSEAVEVLRLGALWPLRRALALGAPEGELEALFAAAPSDGPLAVAASLWRAELAMQQTDTSRAADFLSTRPARDPVPLASLLRARLAFVRNRPDEVIDAYDTALRGGPDHDGLRMEAADAAGILGQSGEMETGYDLLVESGSRLAQVYYQQAAFAAFLGKAEEGTRYLRSAWRMHPIERRWLLASPALAALATRPDTFPVFELDSPADPVIAPPAGERHPLAWPPRAQLWTSGSVLHVEVATARLTVPNGARLAPVRTLALSAADEHRLDEEEALARLPLLLEENRGVTGLANPRRRAEVLATASALARHNRWTEILGLTDGIDGSHLEPVPSDLVQLRAAALTRTDRTGEARSLLIQLAKSDLANRRQDPAALYQLSALMAQDGDYDVALQLVHKGDAMSPIYRNPARVRQLEMQRRLAASPGEMETEHFRLVYPRLTGDRYAKQLGRVLEDEYRRLSRWIPTPPGPRIEVQLYPAMEFFQAYAGAALAVGIFDGQVKVPFADLRSLDPELVAILSHEVGHAMIARATDDQAPRWFQEGLAEHIQMSQDWANPFPDLQATSRVLAFPVIEPILAGFAEAQLIELAYGEAAWVVHYVEARHGVAGIHRLLDAFHDGMDTEEALRSVFDTSVEGFHAGLLQWAVEEAPAAWPTKIRRYDKEYDVPFERSAATAADGRSSHRVSSPSVVPTTPPAELRTRLRSWYDGYSAAIAPFKDQLGPLVDELSIGVIDGHRNECDALGRQIASLRHDERLYGCPLPAVDGELRSALDAFGRMAAACSAGNRTETVASYKSAEPNLAAVAQALRIHGLRP